MSRIEGLDSIMEFFELTTAGSDKVKTIIDVYPAQVLWW